ncbi:hypothetical protein [Rathayibacter sp. VKM Ac-2927]|uniref:hypothetical protein n=1 Tax=Rathayibacter sp. VKM Ac-2927 TaxID=2929478 RepID=UPI001FB22BFE|nr:hypothetical protein [Rathayibacter sp. VKM Ac-2927]MCJ1688643.1 hypothetical protein [Rathayibacter sp. VKM Ac-2927]
MLQITVQERTYLLTAGSTMTETKQAVLDAMRTAPSFLSLRTVLGGQIEVLVTATSTVVLEQHDEAPLPTIPRAPVGETDYDDPYGMDYV